MKDFERELRGLVREYRAIRAPGTLTTRIVAALPAGRSWPRWLTAAGGAAALTLLAMLLLRPGEDGEPPSHTPLASVAIPTLPPTPAARLSPPIRVPGLGGLGKLPVLPPTPRPAVAPDPANRAANEADA